MQAIEIRELNDEELDAIHGAFWANVAGAAVGAVGGGVAGYLASGGDWRSSLQGAVAGGVVGAVNPIAGFTSAARTLGASAVGGAAAYGVDRAVYGRQ